MNLATIGRTTLLLTAFILTACGGGSGTTANTDPTPTATCDPADPATFDECGTVLIGFTDADGDFLNYAVDAISLTLETANGRTVEVLPRDTRVNFTDYVELTELVSAVTVPPATYVSGTITIDYSNAEVVVEASTDPSGSKAAVVTDPDGTPLGVKDLKIVLSERDQLTVVKRRAAFISISKPRIASTSTRRPRPQRLPSSFSPRCTRWMKRTSGCVARS